MTGMIVVGGLVMGSLALTLLLGGVGAAGRLLPHLTCHVRYQLLGYSIAAAMLVFLLALIAPPRAVACLDSCPLDQAAARERGEASMQMSMVAARKAALSEIPRLPQPGRSRAAWLNLVVFGWLSGVCLRGCRLIVRRVRTARLIAKSTPITIAVLEDVATRLGTSVGQGKAVSVRCHRQVKGPAVAGIFRPVLLVPPQFAHSPVAEMELVLLHELAHVRRHDGLVTLLMEVAAALFWFHPLMAWAVLRGRDLQEVAADSRVLAAGVPASRYAQYLLDAFRTLSRKSLTHQQAHPLVGHCLMETRITSILDSAMRHDPPSRRHSLAIAGGFVLLGSLMAAAPVTFQAGGTGDSEPDPALLTHQAIDSLIRPAVIDKMADRYIPGSAVVVVSGDRIVYQAGFGDREVFHEVPVDVDRTIWRIGSITKVLTGIAVMQLVDRERLALDADVNQYLAEFRIRESHQAPIRVRDLLTHTAGFDQPGTDRHVASRAEVRPLGEFLAQNIFPIRPPGQVATYDTYGIVLAGYLVEQRSGLRYEEALQRNIFQPLEMNRSNIVVPPSLQDDVAVGYEFAGHYEAMPWEFMNTDPASTVNATAPDMGNLMVMLLNGGRFKGRQVLSERSVQAMLSRQFANDAEQPGYGFTFWEDRSFGIPAWSHGGSMTGYGAMLYLIPQHRLGIFVANNQESATLANTVISTLVTAWFPQAGAAPALRPAYRGGDPATRLVGTYANAVYNHRNPEQGWRRQPFDVKLDESGHLVVHNQVATRVGPMAFQLPTGVLITFRENERKEIAYMFMGQATFERVR